MSTYQCPCACRCACTDSHMDPLHAKSNASSTWHVMSLIHMYEHFTRSCCSGAAHAVTHAAMASSSSASAGWSLRDWSDDVTHAAHHRRLTTVPGNAVLCGLPVDAHKNELAVLLRNKTHVGVSAPPGSGRTELVAMWTLSCFHFNAKISTGPNPHRNCGTN